MTQPLTLLTGRHPEQLDTEVFVGNFTDDGYDCCGWTTKRCGIVAYCLDGTRADKTLRPVFIQAQEATAAGLAVRDGQVYNPAYEQFLRERGILDLVAQS